MGIFGTSSPFDQDVERATSENNTSEEWGLILEICDRAGASATSSRDCLRAVLRRLGHADPHVQVHAATLLDACVANCGRHFLLEVASREFEAEFRRLLSRAQPAVAQKLRALLKKWAEGEFKNDPQLDLIPSLHAKLCAEAGERPSSSMPTSTDPQSAVNVAAQREQEDLARAIALSLKETAGGSSSTTSTLYPRVESSDSTTIAPAPPVARQVRALYDFEAAEDNELTFMAGEIVHVTDSSDPNWWKGYNERGEGLFPANFVTFDLSEPTQEKESRSGGGGKTVQFVEDAPARIDESVMDEALALLHEADPTDEGVGETNTRLVTLEARVHAMGPLVDAALERADRRHARLTQLSSDLVDALNLYHELMRDPKPMYAPPHAYMPPMHNFPPGALPGTLPGALPPGVLPGTLPPGSLPPGTIPPGASGVGPHLPSQPMPPRYAI